MERDFAAGAWLPQIFNAVKEALFPPRCLSCGLFSHAATDDNDQSGRISWENPALGRSKKEIFKWALTHYVCASCSDNFYPVASPLCPRCGIMFQSREGDDHHCGQCLENPKRFRKARAFGVYDHSLMEAIHRFKFKGKLQLARPLGTLLLAALLAYWQDDPPDLIIPVPLHAGRFRERGFNQSFLLVREWPVAAESIPVQLPDMTVDREVLLRTRRTQPQIGLGRKTRLQNIKNAFDVRDENRIYRKKILLVDDVYTTGATVDECAGALINAGAEWVDVLTLARTMN